MSKEGLHTPSDLISLIGKFNRSLCAHGLTLKSADLLMRFYSLQVISPRQFEDLLCVTDNVQLLANNLRKNGLIELSGMKKTKKRPARLYCLTDKGSKVLAELVKIIEGK